MADNFKLDAIGISVSTREAKSRYQHGIVNGRSVFLRIDKEEAKLENRS